MSYLRTLWAFPGNLWRVPLAVALWWVQCQRCRLWRWPWIGQRLSGRHVDWQLTRCRDDDGGGCGWAGPRRFCWHTYRDDGSGEDVEPVDECPGCGEEI